MVVGQTYTTEGRFHGSRPQFRQPCAGQDLDKASLYREYNWRCWRSSKFPATSSTSMLQPTTCINCQVAALADPSELRPDSMIRDSFAAELAQTLIEGRNTGGDYCREDGHYAENVGQTIVMRLLALRPLPPGVGALAKWQLRRLQEHVNTRIGDPVTDAALSRGSKGGWATREEVGTHRARPVTAPRSWAAPSARTGS